MRIAIDSRYIRERPSGVGAYVEAIVTRLPALAPEIRFLLWTHPLARYRLDPPNVERAVVRPEPNSLWTLLWPHRYGPLAEVDVFHAAHTILPRGLRMATVATIHDLLSIELPRLHRQGWDGVVKRFYYPSAVWRALRRATRLVTTTAAMADRVAHYCPAARGRTVVIPLACDPVFQPATARTDVAATVRALLGTNDPFFIVIGQHSRTKRQADALAAFAAAAPPRWRLVLLQRQTARNPLAELTVRLGIADRTIWLPGLDRASVVTLLQSAAGLLQPSIYEGFGLPVIEAMACGCPTVVSDLPTLREVTGGAAITVPPGDIDRWGAAIARMVASDDLRAELSQRGLVRAARFSWDRTARETLQVYRDAAGS